MLSMKDVLAQREREMAAQHADDHLLEVLEEEKEEVSEVSKYRIVTN